MVLYAALPIRCLAGTVADLSIHSTHPLTHKSSHTRTTNAHAPIRVRVVGMSIHMFTDMCVDMRLDMYLDMCRHVDVDCRYAHTPAQEEGDVAFV